MASIAAIKTAPMFCEDEDNYEQWKILLLWTEFTDLEKIEVAFVILLSFSNCA